VDPQVLQAVRRWADDDLRSLNGQIEFLLRRAIRDAGRAIPRESAGEDADPADRDEGMTE
jgi:hypothetical protein